MLVSFFHKHLLGASLVIFLVLSTGVQQVAYSQYTLDEIGISGGIGYSTFTGHSSGSTSGLGIDVNGMYSHYICGKRYGFHAEIGGHYSSLNGSDDLSFFQNGTGGPFRLKFLNTDAGFFFKLRKNTYHRPSEFALLVGPKVHFRVLANYREGHDSGVLGILGVNTAPVIPAAHLSLWIRRPLGKELSWFLQPGVDYGIIPNFETIENGKFNMLYLFLNVGFSLWESRG